MLDVAVGVDALPARRPGGIAVPARRVTLRRAREVRQRPGLGGGLEDLLWAGRRKLRQEIARLSRLADRVRRLARIAPARRRRLLGLGVGVGVGRALRLGAADAGRGVGAERRAGEGIRRVRGGAVLDVRSGAVPLAGMTPLCRSPSLSSAPWRSPLLSSVPGGLALPGGIVCQAAVSLEMRATTAGATGPGEASRRAETSPPSIADRPASSALPTPCPRLPWKDSSTRVLIRSRASYTPSPRLAQLAKAGASKGLSMASSSLIGSTSARSRLLCWKTSGTLPSSRPWSARFSRRFSRLSRLASARPACESLTKTTPSAPVSTSLRVALKYTCPGTVKSCSRTAWPRTGGRRIGRKSKYRVRSTGVARLTSLPRCSGRAVACRCSSVVVLPPRPGP
ncbi:MAG: hypothetical protein WKG00_14845 [Polyangiaceae bacterium]